MNDTIFKELTESLADKADQAACLAHYGSSLSVSQQQENLFETRQHHTGIEWRPGTSELVYLYSFPIDQERQRVVHVHVSFGVGKVAAYTPCS